ncbi:MAG: ABC transporter ATP-binding protein [Spirochaetales bacterium]|nr:ABC transporter ATP-binding protein [Spirochaetales bacterium]
MDKLVVEHIEKSFDGLPILTPISFSVREREFVSILGPSGCGKSTLLHLCAGLSRPDSGAVRIDGNDAVCMPGTVSYMQQKDLLLPWCTVVQNAGIPLMLKGMSRPDALGKAASFLPEFGLEGFSGYFPSQLSGGMRQRAALLRTYLYRSDIMLLDEPLGALDAITREQMQKWLAAMIEKLGTTVLMVTHDIDEALLLSDRILIFSPLPASIVAELSVQLPHPRIQEQTLLPDFISLKRRVLEHLSMNGAV